METNQKNNQKLEDKKNCSFTKNNETIEILEGI